MATIGVIGGTLAVVFQWDTTIYERFFTAAAAGVVSLAAGILAAMYSKKEDV